MWFLYIQSSLIKRNKKYYNSETLGKISFIVNVFFEKQKIKI